MTPCHVVEIQTPKKVVLNGLWFGPAKPERVIVWVHGMFGSVFSMRGVIDALVNDDTAVLTFNNRGYGTVNDVTRRVSKMKKEYVRAGTAHEVFEDCLDDIDGALTYARTRCANIVLAGHSTGCQKVVYYAAKRRSAYQLILFGPLSDYAGDGKKPEIVPVVRKAKKLVAQNRGAALMPAGSWWHYADAQRFVSLYTPDSVEQSIFPYFDASRRPRELELLTVPVLIFLAGADEYSEIPARKLAQWYGKYVHGEKSRICIIPRVKHNFKEGESYIQTAAREWW